MPRDSEILDWLRCKDDKYTSPGIQNEILEAIALCIIGPIALCILEAIALYIGPDNISPKLLKLAGPSIVTALHSLYTRSLQECKVFKDWKLARLSPIFKKDDELEMGNYLSPECT